MRRCGAVLTAVILLTSVPACSAEDRGVACDGATRLADVVVDIRADLAVGRQVRYIDRRFKPGFRSVGGILHYSMGGDYSGAAPRVLLYMDERLTPEQRAAVRTDLEAEAEVDSVRFEVRPGPNSIHPGGECA
jgi:hypothetical protein